MNRCLCLVVLLWGLAPGAAAVWSDELDEIREKAAALAKEAEELQQAGQKEEAQAVREKLGALKAEAQELQAKAKREGAKQSPAGGEREQQLRELQERSKALMRKAEELRKEGKEDEAREVQAELQNLRREAAELGAGKSGERGPPEERAAELKERIQQLRSAGKNDEAERLEQVLQGKRATGSEANPRGDSLKHLQQAIEHLQAAGLVDEARALQNRMLQLRSGAGGPGGPVDGLPRQVTELQQQVRQLGEHVERLTRQVEELSRRDSPK